MWDKTDSPSVVEIAKPSTKNMWFWPPCCLIPFPSPLTWFHLPPTICLMIVSVSSPAYIGFSTLASHLILSPTYFFSKSPILCFYLTVYFLSLCFCSTSPASPPLPSPPPQGQEGAQEAQEARPQRWRAPRRRAEPGPQPRPLLNQKIKKNPSPFFPFLLCQLQFACLPVVPSPRSMTPNTTLHTFTA